MKKILTIVCIFVQAVIIAIAEFVVIAIITGWYADTIGYYGFWNAPVALIVGTMVLSTWIVFVKSLIESSEEA